MKKILILVMCFVLMFSFTACNNSSTSGEVSKESTPTATVCAHNYSAATCISAKKCTNCGQTSGSALGHNYSAATCSSAGKCSRCGQTSGVALGHNYSSATCTAPQKCSVCGQTSGSALGHNYSSGKCSRCDAKDPNYVAYSRVKGEITYKYNNFVGTRGDDGAKVVFIPKKTSLKNKAEDSALMLIAGKYDSGIIVMKCDGYGRFDTGEEYIPAGDYVVIVVSKNTTARLSQLSVSTLKPYVGSYLTDSQIETLSLFIGLEGCVIDSKTLQEGYEMTISHDFGLSKY